MFKYYFILLFILSACSTQDYNLSAVLDSIKTEMADDSRTAIFNYEIRESGDGLVISGETNIPEIIKAINDSISIVELSVTNDMRLLPSEDLGLMKWALINVSVGNVRVNHQHTSELVTQSTGGTPLNLLKRSGGWFLIQTPDKYIGWIDGGAITRLDANTLISFLEEEKVIFTGVYGFSYTKPQKDAPIISDVVGGNIYRLVDEEALFWKIEYPDGRLAFLDKTLSEKYSSWLLHQKYDHLELKNTAYRLNGIPYLWGGTSTKGVDCSGFTKTVYFLNGILLPRDASQQALVGDLIDDSGNFSSLQTGDLLFFGRPATDSTSEKVVHVGMWIDNMKFIHASGKVHTSSMDPDSPDFDDYNHQRYLSSRRILNSEYFNNLQVQNYFGDGLSDE